MKRGGDGTPLVDRLRNAILKPVEADAASAPKASEKPMPVDELRAAARSANDKERLVGLLAAPVAAAIGLVVTGALIANDPPALLRSGHANTLHVNPSLYYEVGGVLLVLSLLMLALAMFRKRLYLGVVMALYGLAIFNLRYWGFGIPFIMAGAWLLVRAYRLQRDLREATGEAPSRRDVQRRGTSPKAPSGPAASKRYTPPAPRSKRPLPAKPAKEQRAG